MRSPEKHVPRLLIEEHDLQLKSLSELKIGLNPNPTAQPEIFELKLSLKRYHHLKNVLRLSPGQTLELQLWEKGHWARFVVLAWDKASLCLKPDDSGTLKTRVTDQNNFKASTWTSRLPWQNASEKLSAQKLKMSQIELSLGLLKNQDTLSWVIEKLIELGCQKINLIQCEFSQLSLKNFNANAQKLVKLEQIAENALEQSQQFARVHFALFTFGDYCQKLRVEKNELFVGSLPGQDFKNQTEFLGNLRLGPEEKNPQKYHLLIGPEGGLSPQELKICQELGAIGLNLGPAILRTETAALIGFYELKKILADWKEL